MSAIIWFMVYLRSNTKNLNQIINFEKSLNICNIICLYNTFKTLSLDPNDVCECTVVLYSFYI